MPLYPGSSTDIFYLPCLSAEERIHNGEKPHPEDPIYFMDLTENSNNS